MPDLDLDELRRLAEEHRDGDSFRARLARGVLALIDRVQIAERERDETRRERDALERELELVADALGHIERASDHQRGPASSYVRASGESMAEHIRGREREWSQFDEAVGDAFVARSELAEARARVRALPRQDFSPGEVCGYRCGAEMVSDDHGDYLSADDVLEAIGGGDGE